eukprot:SM000160S02546  [mRNA]  locus=s160:173641:174439:- [translate_table: standard]
MMVFGLNDSNTSNTVESQRHHGGAARPLPFPYTLLPHGLWPPRAAAVASCGKSWKMLSNTQTSSFPPTPMIHTSLDIQLNVARSPRGLPANLQLPHCCQTPANGLAILKVPFGTLAH